MKNRAHDLARYTFVAGEPLLLDTNIWLFAYPAPSASNPFFARKYTAALKAMLAAKVRLLLDPLILGEYVNRYVRIEWEAAHRITYPRFKDFRRSAGFAAIGKDVASNARAVHKLCSRVDHPFSSLNVDEIVTDFETGGLDINDALLIAACRHRACKLVTDDGDCTVGDVDVLTANPKLIIACR